MTIKKKARAHRYTTETGASMHQREDPIRVYRQSSRKGDRDPELKAGPAGVRDPAV